MEECSSLFFFLRYVNRRITIEIYHRITDKNINEIDPSLPFVKTGWAVGLLKDIKRS